jgi:hypothetical protein
LVQSISETPRDAMAARTKKPKKKKVDLER